MWATFREDAVLKGFLVYSAVLVMPFLAPLVGVVPVWLQVYSDSLFEVLLLPAVVVALQLSADVVGAVIVAVVCDRGNPYLSTGVHPA